VDVRLDNEEGLADHLYPFQVIECDAYV